MDLSVGIWNGDAKDAHTKTIWNFWLKADSLPLEMMEDLCNPNRNNESVNVNSCTHDSIDQDTDDVDNMEFSSNKESTIVDINISSSEDGITQT